MRRWGWRTVGNVVRIGGALARGATSNRGYVMTKMEKIEVDGLTIFRFDGPLNQEGLEEVEASFESALRRPGVRGVVDLTHVEMVTTPALSMFISAAAAARESGGKLVFTESTPPVRDVLKRLRLHNVLETIEGLEEAMSTVREGSGH